MGKNLYLIRTKAKELAGFIIDLSLRIQIRMSVLDQGIVSGY